MMDTCSYIFKRGVNKDKQCGKKTIDSSSFCKIHNGRVLELGKLPVLVLSAIVDRMIITTDLNESKIVFTKLVALSQSCREYQSIINEDKWKLLYDHVKLCQLVIREQYCPELFDNMSYKNRLHLLLGTGCQRCDAPYITKIYWPFPIRVCTTCFNSITIRDYELQDVQYTSNYYVHGSSWSRYRGTQSFRYYLKYLITKKLKCSLEEYRTRQNEKSHQHKVDIATSIGISLEELTKSLERTILMESAFPDTKMVHQTFFQNKALKKAKSEFEKYKGTPPPSYRDIMRECESIHDQDSYDTWFVNFESTKKDTLAIIEKEAFQILYSNSKEKIINSLNLHPYFSNLTLYDLVAIIPETHQFINFPIDTSYDSLKKQVVKYMKRLAQFIKKENITFNEVTYLEAKIRLQSTIKFPAKEPSDLKKFILDEFKHFIDASDVDTVNSWGDAVVLLNNIPIVKNKNKKLQCKICLGTRMFTFQGLEDHARSCHRINLHQGFASH